jgi:hypothetical protein
MTAQAFSIGEPVTVGANIVRRSTSRTSRSVRPSRRYSVWLSRDICLRKGPRMRPPFGQTALIIFISSSTTMKSSSLSFTSARNASTSSPVGPAAGWRNVPLMGFIIATPSRTETCRSGVAPTAVTVWAPSTPGVWIAKVQ